MSLSGHSAARRRRIYWRRRFITFGSIVVLLTGVVYFGMLFGAPVPATAAELKPVPALTQSAAEIAWPEYGAGAVGAVGHPGILAEHGEQASVPIASITKIVTALVVLNEKPLAAGESGPDIQFTDRDVQIYYDTIAENGSAAPVSGSLVLSERQTLEAMLIPSANNYSVSLANWAFGSVDEYLQRAGEWLQATGLTETSVADASGLSPQSVSSPADLVALGKLALADPTIAEIVSMPSVELPYLGTVVNTNKLLGDDGFTGIKTGTTDEAGACLLFARDVVIGSNTVTIVGVLLGGDTHPELNNDIETIVASVEESFREVTLSTAGEPVGSYSTEWGQSSAIVAAEDVSTLVWSDEPISAAAEANPIETVQAGEEVGSMRFTVGGEEIEVPLTVTDKITGPDASWRLANPGALLGS